MPANEEVWRNPKVMHGVFALSAFALLAATLWMMKADYADEWRPIQRTNLKLKAKQFEGEIAALKTADFQARTQELEAAENAAKARQDEHKAREDEVRARRNDLDGQFQLLSRQVKFQRARRDVARANLDLQIRDGLLGAQLRPGQEAFDQEQQKVDELELQLQQLQAKFDAAKAELAELTGERDKIDAELKKHRADLALLQEAKNRIAPEGWLAWSKRKLMEVPIVEGFNGHLKPNQIWLPDLTQTLGMKATARFDRCITCHINIDAVGEGNKPAFPYDPHGITMANAEQYLSGKNKKEYGNGSQIPSWKREDGTIVYGHPFATHPHPELYLTDKSPHPMQKFGCTSCHEGQGSGTSFHNASHSPNSPDVGEKWHEKYGYFYNHFWEYPMYPSRLREAACLKCHHNVVELGVNPTYGASAPKLYEGYQLILQYGCFGCHEINGYNTGKPIGPDIRLEPQTEDEAERIAADPTAVAGTQRKVGPGLRHFAAKTTPGWAEFWVKKPSDFRPDTRMPQFFGLTNQKDPHAKKLQPAEIVGIVKFLFAKSEEIKFEKWASGYKPDAKRGQVLFSQRGCLGCHSHADFPGIPSEFGPDLTNVHKKISSIEWLYTWVRDPTRHSARTRMPDLYLDPEGEGEKYVDPAACRTAPTTANW
jgi:cbb3-type cytochrome oxidase cytochrome c subunit